MLLRFRVAGSHTAGLARRPDVPYLFTVPDSRFTEEYLIAKALRALKEVRDHCDRTHGPTQPTFALRFTLAWLANKQRDRDPYDGFWRFATAPNRSGCTPGDASDYGRHANLDNLYRYICRVHGQYREEDD